MFVILLTEGVLQLKITSVAKSNVCNTYKPSLFSFILTVPSIYMNLSSLKYWGVTINLNILQEKLISREAQV